MNSQRSAVSGPQDKPLPFDQRQLYRQIIAALGDIDRNWTPGSWQFCREKHPALLARIRELEEKIETNYKSLAYHNPDLYRKTKDLVSAWKSSLKEMIFLNTTHLSDDPEKTRPAAHPGPQSPNVGQPVKPQTLPGIERSREDRRPR